MDSTALPVRTGWVEVDGDSLFFEDRGKPDLPPVLLIPPAGGDGWQYSRLAEKLADRYRVITYDRRANARSTGNTPRIFSIRQQSEDAVQVLKRLDETTAFIFGNSSGAVIALDLAARYPEVVRKVIAHEAPIPNMLPDGMKWHRFFAWVYRTSFSLGPSWAALFFMLGSQLPVRGLISASRFVNQHQKDSPVPYLDARKSAEVLTRMELVPVTDYRPDVSTLLKHQAQVVIGIGEWALQRNTWYAQANQILAERLGAKPVIFPGHHGSFMDMPDEWSALLDEILSSSEN
jgi:pimeloyl-ACP methyl ester carboxylesterase